MKKSMMITGLDIGSSKIAAVAAQVDRMGLFRILAQVSLPSKGVSRGAIEDLNEAVDSVSKTLTRLSEKISKKADNIYVNISGSSIKGEKSRGMIPLSIRGREIGSTDIRRCIGVASTIRLPFDREILHAIVSGFSVDEQPLIENPTGLYASRLACEAYIITAGMNNIQNIYKCLSNAGYDTTEIVFTGIANGASVLDPKDTEGNIAVLDVGSSITELCLFSRGRLVELTVMPYGSKDIKGEMKESAELNTILSKTRAVLEEFSGKSGKVDSVLLTGSIVFTDNIIEILENMLAYPVPMKTAVARDVKGDISGVDSMRLVTAIGLVKYGYEKYRKNITQGNNLLKNVSAKVVDIFNNYF
ncbi:MAG: cell division protein FtsA [Candidatus Omnitrophica bacterium]|nr:cell division protein FtsA [Candidatus Omnitrophota bacterium]